MIVESVVPQNGESVLWEEWKDISRGRGIKMSTALEQVKLKPTGFLTFLQEIEYLTIRKKPIAVSEATTSQEVIELDEDQSAEETRYIPSVYSLTNL